MVPYFVTNWFLNYITCLNSYSVYVRLLHAEKSMVGDYKPNERGREKGRRCVGENVCPLSYLLCGFMNNHNEQVHMYLQISI